MTFSVVFSSCSNFFYDLFQYSVPPVLIASFNTVSYSLLIYNLFNDVAEFRFVDRCCLCNKTNIHTADVRIGYISSVDLHQLKTTLFGRAAVGSASE